MLAIPRVQLTVRCEEFVALQDNRVRQVGHRCANPREIGVEAAVVWLAEREDVQLDALPL